MHANFLWSLVSRQENAFLQSSVHLMDVHTLAHPCKQALRSQQNPPTALCPSFCFLPECDVVEMGIYSRREEIKITGLPWESYFLLLWVNGTVILLKSFTTECDELWRWVFNDSGLRLTGLFSFLSTQSVHFTAPIGKIIGLGCSQEEWDRLGISGRPPS